MLKELFKEQRFHVNAFFDQIDIEKAEAFLQACASCKGLLIFTGVGKSGIIAEKIAMTMISTGTKALYLPTTNFLHGDLGILTSNDILVLLSKSGETEELHNLIPFARKKQAKILSLVSNPYSRLGRESDLSLCLPVEKELCPFDLAPTTSTAVQLLFGDALAVALMKEKQFSIDEYALNHPSGAIGRKIKMSISVEQLMFQDEHAPLCLPDNKLGEVITELSNKKCGCLVVTNTEKELLGIFTDGDLRRGLQNHGPSVLEKKIQDLMTRTPAWISKSSLAWEAMKVMQKDPKGKWITVLPVLEEGRVVGVIRMHDIVQAGIS